MVDRVVQVPFNYRVSEGDENKNLLTELLAEREGILAWMVRGAIQYAKDGLGTCSAVEAATEAYVKENNSVALFLDDCVKAVDSMDIQAKEMLERYRGYCKDPLEVTPLSGKALGKELEKLGYKKRTGRGNKVFWLNVAFKEEDEEGEKEDTGGDIPF
jgi:phage/plasmid-associated DNA primase